MPGSIISSLDVAIEVEPGKSNWRAADTCAYFMAPADPQYRKELAVAVLVDEMTGQVHEATASHITLDVIKHYFLTHVTSDPVKTISASIQAAHAALLEKKRTDPDFTAVGAMVTVAVIAFDREISGIVELYVGNAGSNRAFHFRRGVLRQLAADPNGAPAPGEPESLAPAAGTPLPPPPPLTHYAGMRGPLVLQIAPVELLGPGDVVLLCTHRLTDAVKEDGLASAVALNKQDGGARQLVVRALQQPGDDNLTVVTLRLVHGPHTVAALPERLPPSRSAMVALVGLGLVISLLLGFAAFMIVGGQTPFNSAPNTATIEVAQFQPIRRTPTPRPSLTPGAGVFSPPIILMPFTTPQPTVASFPTTEPFFAPAPTDIFQTGAPALLGPIDGQIFDRGALVYLTWNSVGQLPQDVYYAVTLRKSQNGVTIDTYEYYTKQTAIQIPPAILVMLRDARPPSAIAWNTGAVIGANENRAAANDTRFEWYLSLRRLLRGSPDVSGEWFQMGSPSQVFTFILREPVATATPRRYP